MFTFGGGGVITSLMGAERGLYRIVLESNDVDR